MNNNNNFVLKKLQQANQFTFEIGYFPSYIQYVSDIK